MTTQYTFVGRQQEAAKMEELRISSRSEMLAIVGRRRVGKTELIREVFAGKIIFEITGIQHAKTTMQLKNFRDKFNQFAKPDIPVKTPSDWQEAFNWLKTWLQNLPGTEKRILFFDEIPWMATPRSMFLELLGHFWNDYASRANVLVVICGSAAGWMIKKVVHHKGSLHNRITHLIHLNPFTLAETEELLRSKGITLERNHILQLYMVTGGIPYYLASLSKTGSVAEHINRLCFEQGGILTDEFGKLFSSLYDKADNHIAIIRALATKWKGLTRTELVKETSLSDGGSINRFLQELEASDFITTVAPFYKKKKETLYRLTDNYSLFFLKFMEDRKNRGADGFLKIQQSQAWKAWTGYAFENICLYHITQIKKALGISGVATEVSGFVHKGSESEAGFQIDLLIDRADQVIHLCEMKFYDGPFTITKSYEEQLRLRRTRFREITGTRKTIFLTMVSTYGLVENSLKYSFESQLEQNALFEPQK